MRGPSPGANRPHCANSPFEDVSTGVRWYLSQGIPASKLVLGLPWCKLLLEFNLVARFASLTERLCHSADGYDYVCNGTVATCCSQDVNPAAGTALGHAQIGFGPAMSLLRGNATAGRQWNNHSRSPFFEYTSAADGKRHQVWYDDPQSLQLKYDLVTKLGLRGVGFWPADIGSLAGPGGTGAGTWNESDVKSMWAAVP